ncbi:triphosphoribosyl-dephospho-CoA synthase [Methanosphaera sp.]
MMLTSQDVARLGEIATLLEVSGYPKPGNVHRTQDFEDMSYEDFLISSASIRENLDIVAYDGARYYPNMLNRVPVGECILSCVRSTQNLVNTNTNLGISMLMVPLAATFGALLEEKSINSLPGTLDIIIKNTEPDDAIALVKAISLSKAGGMDNKTLEYDVNDVNTIDEIRRNQVNLHDLLDMSAEYDKISYELTNGLPVILNYGYPTYCKYMDEYSRNDVTLEIYLNILANVPDTLINRKYGGEIAEKVSKKAQVILKDTEIGTSERLDKLKDFDVFLRNKKYNPGTTADFTAASLFVGLVDKYSQSGL